MIYNTKWYTIQHSFIFQHLFFFIKCEDFIKNLLFGMSNVPLDKT